MSEQFSGLINRFVEEIEGLKFALKPVMASSRFLNAINGESLRLFLEEHGETGSDDQREKKSVTIGPAHFLKLKHLFRRVASTNVASRYLPESLFVSLVSRFDAFIGGVIRIVLIQRTSLLEASQKPLAFSELFALKDLNEARELLIEREIESVLRKSHRDHLAWFDNKIGTDFLTTLPCLPAFIELTERRNLFSHCDGIVSRQYLSNCREANALEQQINVGVKLEVSKSYYSAACDCLIEIGVRIAHGVWRKLKKENMVDADKALFCACFDLLEYSIFSLAHQLLEYAHELKKHSSEQQRLMFRINLAQAKKWLGRETECRSLLEGQDWSATSRDFRMCVAVLREDYEQAVAIMKQIGDESDELTSDNYLNWPVFRKARSEPVFQSGYREVFGKEMELGQTIDELTSRAVDRYLMKQRNRSNAMGNKDNDEDNPEIGESESDAKP